MDMNWGVFLEESPTGDGPYWKLALDGAKWTVLVSLGGWGIALLIGSLIGILRTVPNKLLVWLGDAYVELFRNIPLLVQLFLWFFVLPEVLPAAAGRWLKQDLPYPELTTGIIGLGLFTAARVAVQVSAGIKALPRGQTAAGLALGFTRTEVYLKILLPQAFRIIIPPLTSEFMSIFKNSSVALGIGLTELVFQMRQMVEYSSVVIETIAVYTLIYIALALLVNRFMAWLERAVRIPGLIAGGGK